MAVIYFDWNFLALFVRQLELLGVGLASSLVFREHLGVKVDLHTQVFYGNVLGVVLRSGLFYFEVCAVLRAGRVLCRETGWC